MQSDTNQSVPQQIAELADRLARLEGRLGRAPDLSPDVRNTGHLGHCNLPPVPERTFGPEVSPERARLVRDIGRKWVSGTKLRYYFYTSGPYAGASPQKEIVRRGFELWKELGIGISFQEITDITEAEIRIGFLQGDGAWSYIGRDIIDIPGQGERTMNFGWDLTKDPRGVDVPVHEIGHTLGFPHEHQNPFSGIVWNEQAVYEYFGKPPNSWTRESTYFNVLRKLSTTDVAGSPWDPNSIMHYEFDAGLINQPERYRTGLRPAGGLSATDITEAQRFYPLLEDKLNSELVPFKSESLVLAAAEQRNFSVIPNATREYTIQTFGGSDTVVILFEDQGADLKFVDGDDDSGTDRNASLKVRLYKGKSYVLRIRLYSNYATGGSALMMT